MRLTRRDWRTAVPDGGIDLRYATSNNSVGVPLPRAKPRDQWSQRRRTRTGHGCVSDEFRRTDGELRRLWHFDGPPKPPTAVTATCRIHLHKSQGDIDRVDALVAVRRAFGKGKSDGLLLIPPSWLIGRPSSPGADLPRAGTAFSCG